MLKRLILLFILIAAVVAFFAFDLDRFLSLKALQAQRSSLVDFRDAQPLLSSFAFFGIYVLATALSLPGAAILTLAGGAVFGLWWGVLIASFASTIGATGAFLVSRYLLRGTVQQRYGNRLKTINAGVERDGAFYLFTLRLVPVFPFFLINLLFGLTPMKTRSFYWVSQVGMFAGTLVYVNAGTQIAQIESLSGILSPGLIGAFVLLGVFPLIARKISDAIRARRVYRGYRKPKSFDRNLIVIGAGSAGLVAAFIAAAVRAKVTLIERDRMGGDCLNTGCVPSKALIRSSRYAAQLKEGQNYGFREVTGQVDFKAVMQRVHAVVREIEPHDSVERYTEMGVDCVRGEARIVDPWTVEVEGRRLTARDIVVATGAAPFVPPLPGLDAVPYLTSENLWDLEELPGRLIVLGGGPIGCELSQAFARLGSQVWQVEMAPQLMPREDEDVAERVRTRFEAEGVQVLTGTQALRVESGGESPVLVCEDGDGEKRLAFDRILVAVGRAARLSGFGLEELGVRSGRTLEVNEFLQTNFPNIYACGDVAGPYQFTHTASHMAWYTAVNSLFGPLLSLRGGKFKVDYSVIPWATFTEPEVAHVGLNEREAREQHVEYELTRYELSELDRAIAEGEKAGFVKVLTVPGKDRILGATIVGAQAGELIAEFVLAMRQGLGLNKLLSTIHIYPTLMEANKYAAGNWKRAHQPERALRWLERFHKWRRD